MHILSVLFFQVQKHMLDRWETEGPFDDQLCDEYVYQKLFKLDNTPFGVFLCPTVYIPYD